MSTIGIQRQNVNRSAYIQRVGIRFDLYELSCRILI